MKEGSGHSPNTLFIIFYDFFPSRKMRFKIGILWWPIMTTFRLK